MKVNVQSMKDIILKETKGNKEYYKKNDFFKFYI